MDHSSSPDAQPTADPPASQRPAAQRQRRPCAFSFSARVASGAVVLPGAVLTTVSDAFPAAVPSSRPFPSDLALQGLADRRVGPVWRLRPLGRALPGGGRPSAARRRVALRRSRARRPEPPVRPSGPRSPASTHPAASIASDAQAAAPPARSPDATFPSARDRPAERRSVGGSRGARDGRDVARAAARKAGFRRLTPSVG
jgi:hypothetical protein